MIELGLSDLLGVDHGDIEPMSRADEIEADEALRVRILREARDFDARRSSIMAASGADLDAIGLRYGIRRLGAVPGIDGPPAA